MTAIRRLRETINEGVAELLPSIEYRAMRDAEDRHAAYRLRYDAYRREDRVAENETGLSVDFADELPNTRTYGVFLRDWLLSSIRVSVLTRTCSESPSVDVFRQIITERLKTRAIIVDPTRFVSDTEAAREFPELPFITLRIATMAAEHYGAAECLSTVRLNHVPFYRRIFLFTPVSDPLYYPPMNMRVQLTAITLDKVKKEVAERYPLFRSTAVERRLLFGPPGLMPGIAD